MNNNNNYNSFFNNNNLEYPYGELPLKYTKQGQQLLREKLKNRNFAEEINPPQNNSVYNNNFNNINNNVSSLSQNTPQQNNLDISTLLPLLIGLNGGNKNNQLDMINKLMPLLKNNGNSLDTTALLKLFTELNKKNTVVSSVTPPDNNKNGISINDLKKVDE